MPEEKFVENLAQFKLGAGYYWRNKEKEVDFLKDSVPVEVKFKSKIAKKDIGYVLYFIEKYGKTLGIRKGYVITKDVEGKIGGVSRSRSGNFV